MVIGAGGFETGRRNEKKKKKKRKGRLAATEEGKRSKNRAERKVVKQK